MQGGNYWECPHCGTRNKGFAAVCLGCSRERNSPVPRDRGYAPDRVRLTRGARWLLAFAFATAAILGFVLVRTFRSPALEAADVPLAEEAADTGREPVPPQATMPGAPDSGWMGAPEAAPDAASPPAPAPAVRTYAPPPPRPPAPSRRYSDDDLRAIAARKGAAAARDRGYLIGLRQRRVDDLTARLARADSSEERTMLREWLAAARRDLERALRE